MYWMVFEPNISSAIGKCEWGAFEMSDVSLFHIYCVCWLLIFVSFAVPTIARNKVNVLAINVCAKAIGLQKIAVCTRARTIAEHPMTGECARRSIVGARRWVELPF